MLICTYNRYDVDKYHITRYPYILFQLKDINIIPMCKRDIDILFVGQDKGRMDYIERLYNQLTKLGLRCVFYVVNPLRECQTQGIHCSDWISYQCLIEKTENAKCIVNILQPGAEGVTLRDVEAYNYGSFMLTNNHSPELLDIYNEGQLIDINSINESTVSIIRQRTSAFPKRKNTNTLDHFYNWVNSRVCSRCYP